MVSSASILAVKLGIAVLGLFRAAGAWLLGRKNRKIGRMEEKLRQYEATIEANEDAKAARMRQRQLDSGGVSDDEPDRFRRD